MRLFSRKLVDSDFRSNNNCAAGKVGWSVASKSGQLGLQAHLGLQAQY